MITKIPHHGLEFVRWFDVLVTCMFLFQSKTDAATANLELFLFLMTVWNTSYSIGAFSFSSPQTLSNLKWISSLPRNTEGVDVLHRIWHWLFRSYSINLTRSVFSTSILRKNLEIVSALQPLTRDFNTATQGLSSYFWVISTSKMHLK